MQIKREPKFKNRISETMLNWEASFSQEMINLKARKKAESKLIRSHNDKSPILGGFSCPDCIQLSFDCKRNAACFL